MKLQKIALLAAVLSLVGSSCTFYEDGPIISVIPKKNRIANIWEAEEVTKANGDDITDNYDSWTWTFTEDGDATIEYTLLINITIEGEWNLIDEGSIFQLITNELLGQNIAVYDILRLTEDEFWLVDEDGTEFHLRTK